MSGLLRWVAAVSMVICGPTLAILPDVKNGMFVLGVLITIVGVTWTLEEFLTGRS